MSNHELRDPEQSRRLTTAFAGHLNTAPLLNESLDQAAVVILDANVLLDLYEIGFEARAEVITVLQDIGNRLWVPHQAALEFSRNRTRTVVDRVSRYKQIRDSLNKAHDVAAQALYKPVQRLVEIREKSRSTREWSPDDHHLDLNSLRERLSGILEDAVKEAEKLRDEHDVVPQNVFTNDQLLIEIDELLAGHIGPPFSSGKTREYVDEAVNFRYPNNIPPGADDSEKPTNLLSAGDYLLWRQVLDYASSIRERVPFPVVLVTSERKGDWWTLTNGERMSRARPELVQELYDESGAMLTLLSLADFIAEAQSKWKAPISPTTVEQLREAAESSNAEPVTLIALTEISIDHVTSYAYQLAREMGFDHVAVIREDKTKHIFATVGGNGQYAVVGLATSVSPVRVEELQEFYGLAVQEGSVTQLIYITLGTFSVSSLSFARDHRIDTISGIEFARKLSQYIGANVVVGGSK